MNIKFLTGLIVLCLLANSCKNKSDKVDPEEVTVENPEIKNISELTFRDILFLLHKENEFGADYHGESFGQEALSDITLTTMTKTDCGEKMALINTSAKKQVQVAVMATFDFPNNPVNEIAMVYIMKPSDTLPVGRNVLCYNGKKYTIDRKVLSAGYFSK